MIEILDVISNEEYKALLGYVSRSEEEDRRLDELFDLAKRLHVRMDPVNAICVRVVLFEGGITNNKPLVDSIAKECELAGLTIQKSAIAERLGRKKDRYSDSHYGAELLALRRVDEFSLVCYEHLTANSYKELYRLKREWVRAILLMRADELATFCAVTDPETKQRLVRSTRTRYQ